jgi:uncharacterized protein with PQ loop repeat
MLFKTIFFNLYPVVGIITVFGYIPQIKSLLRAKRSPNNISIKSWLLWVLSAFISLGYGVYCLNDMPFIIMTLIGLFLMLYVIGLILYRRYVTFGDYKNLLEVLISYFFCKPFFSMPEKVYVLKNKRYK